MSYGKLIIERELTKAEARELEEKLSKSTDVFFDGWVINVVDIQVGEVGHNIQHLTVRGTA